LAVNPQERIIATIADADLAYRAGVIAQPAGAAPHALVDCELGDGGLHTPASLRLLAQLAADHAARQQAIEAHAAAAKTLPTAARCNSSISASRRLSSWSRGRPPT
jgi:D-serine deaminase-like pyridoxal phosphate-dependent protein